MIINIPIIKSNSYIPKKRRRRKKIIKDEEQYNKELLINTLICECGQNYLINESKSHLLSNFHINWIINNMKITFD